MAVIKSVSIFVLLSAALFVTGHEEFKTVQTEYGAIRGKLMSTIYDAKPYYSYRGIPYAKPPLNELRFKVSNRTMVIYRHYSDFVGFKLVL